MKLLRDTLLLRALRRLLAGRRHAVRRLYTVTVPAPLERASAGNNVIELHRRFDEERRRLLAERVERQDRLNAGGTLDFLAETKRSARTIRGRCRLRVPTTRTGGSRSPGRPTASWS